MITTDPEVLKAGTPDKTSSHVYALGIEGDKHVIKLKRPYNEDCQDGRIPDLLQLNDLFENKEFEKIINYNSKTEENE